MIKFQNKITNYNKDILKKGAPLPVRWVVIDMGKYDLKLKPSYWASVSGGKDSLYMLNLILHNLDRYQLDGVVHFELEIDYPFIKNVIDYMENECKNIILISLELSQEKAGMNCMKNMECLLEWYVGVIVNISWTH